MCLMCLLLDVSIITLQVKLEAFVSLHLFVNYFLSFCSTIQFLINCLFTCKQLIFVSCSFLILLFLNLPSRCLAVAWHLASARQPPKQEGCLG